MNKELIEEEQNRTAPTAKHIHPTKSQSHPNDNVVALRHVAKHTNKLHSIKSYINALII